MLLETRTTTNTLIDHIDQTHRIKSRIRYSRKSISAMLLRALIGFVNVLGP